MLCFALAQSIDNQAYKSFVSKLIFK